MWTSRETWPSQSPSNRLSLFSERVVQRKNNLRVVLTSDLIRQDVAVEVDGAEVETLDSDDPDST
jgi:hypothetical protein